MSVPDEVGPPRRTPNGLLWALLAAGTALLCVSIFAVWIVWDVWQRPFPRRGVHVTGDLDIRADDELGYAANEGARTLFELDRSGLSFAVYNDAIGARVDAPGDETPARVDVAVVGGSYAWGWGVESPATFAHQLRRDLGVSVANLAVRGYSTVQSWLTFERRASLAPKVLVYAYIPDHAKRNLRPCGPSMVPFCKPVPYVAEEPGAALGVHPPRTELFDADLIDAYMREVLTLPEGRITFADLRWRARTKLRGFETREVPLARFETRGEDIERRGLAFLVPRLAESATRAGATLVFLYVPPLYKPRVQPPPPWLPPLVAESGAVFVDFTPRAEAWRARDSGLLTFAADPHPNAHAHRLLAQTLAAPVRRALAGGAAATTGAAAARTRARGRGRRPDRT